MAKRVRIKDIAERSGVSKGTVDRVIHDRGHVAPEVKKRVLEVMEELNYRPNKLARALSNNRTWKLASLTPNYENDSFWKQPIKGIELGLNAVMDFGFSMDYFHFADDDVNTFQLQAKKILKGSYDAVIVAPIFIDKAKWFLDECEQRDLKYFLINTFIKREDENFRCYIGQDSFQSGVLAAKLLDFGIDNGDAVMVLHLEKGVYNSQHLIQKEEGFHQYFVGRSNRNIQVIKTSFENPNNRAAFKKFINYHLQSYPKLKGIFVTTSRLHHLVQVLDKLKISDLKLVGFDLIDENLKYLEEGKIDFLINQNPIRQGYLGIVNIFNHLVNKREIDRIQHLPLHVIMMENVKYYLEEPKHFQFVL